MLVEHLYRLSFEPESQWSRIFAPAVSPAGLRVDHVEAYILGFLAALELTGVVDPELPQFRRWFEAQVGPTRPGSEPRTPLEHQAAVRRFLGEVARYVVERRREWRRDSERPRAATG